MIKESLIGQNPLRLLGFDNDSPLPESGFGVVCARAGVGKTALLVQIALNLMLRSKNVLHISLNDPVDKVTLWYKEVYNNLAKGHDTHQAEQLWQLLLPHRFIMNFRVEGFSVPKLEERLMDLISQDIFTPQMMIIDGFNFDDAGVQSLSVLKQLVNRQPMAVWFTMRTHRHDHTPPEDMPPALIPAENLFNIVLQLQPEGKTIHVRLTKGVPADTDAPTLCLDPSTMLVKKD
jgi:hypothetical protein